MSITLMSRNTERKANYARMASEQDKDFRNAAISAALGQGEANVEGKTRFKTVVTEEVYQTKSGKTKTRRVHTREEVRFIPVDVKLPTAPSRSEKRARRKAKESRLVCDVSHPNGRCGNIGCRGCSRLPLHLAARPGSRAFAERT